MTMIDKEVLLQRINTQFWSEIENIIISAPSIDIVRCRECKHRKKNCFCLEHNRYEKNDNGYCSYGEREGE